ncbi:MerR family transcriptional regulator [uncultured Abyssibacter sp.]|uniref:MerR family transcriptional regulator n=1 Tax=uncultured Abyssibacter sp. TaxID=2320202 RepID=UPI0032B15364
MNDTADVVDNDQAFRIGAVERATGIPANTIRVWERRYGLVKPARDETGTRLYSQQDIEYLGQVRSLIDAGDSIGYIASLGKTLLPARIESLASMPNRGLARRRRTGLAPLLLIGPTLAERLGEVDLPGYTIHASYATPADARKAQLPGHSNAIAVVETEQVTRSLANDLAIWRDDASLTAVIIVYSYARQSDLAAIRDLGLLILREPIDAEMLRHVLLTRKYWLAPDEQPGDYLSEPIPPQMFTKKELVTLALMQTSVSCECPRHLAELLISLSAFERYSQLCEDRSTEDAAIHAMLRGATAHARSTMEAALKRVVDHEKIDLSQLR